MDFDRLLDTLMTLRNQYHAGTEIWTAVDWAIIKLIASRVRPPTPQLAMLSDPQVISRLKGAIAVVTAKCYKQEISSSDAVTDIIGLLEAHTTIPRDLQAAPSVEKPPLGPVSGVWLSDRPPPFCIQPQDSLAVQIISTWIERAREGGTNKTKLDRARRHLNAIAQWQSHHPDLCHIPD